MRTSFEEQELWWSVADSLTRHWRRLTGKKPEERTLSSLGGIFFETERQIAALERSIAFGEKRIGRAILYGGADGLRRLVYERLLSPSEKAELLSRMLVKETEFREGIKLLEDARAILTGVLRDALLKKEAEFRSRIGEEAGIAC